MPRKTAPQPIHPPRLLSREDVLNAPDDEGRTDAPQPARDLRLPEPFHGLLEQWEPFGGLLEAPPPAEGGPAALDFHLAEAEPPPRRAANRKKAAGRLSEIQLRILRLTAACPCKGQALADALRHDYGYLKQVLAGLRKAGLLGNDHRGYFPTPKGLRLLRRLT
jgi:hypothetical protein